MASPLPEPNAHQEDPDLLKEWELRFSIKEEVTAKDIKATLLRISPWKAPGEDHLPTGLLKACGQPLFKVLAMLTEAYLRLRWFPERFKRTCRLVLIFTRTNGS